MLNKQKYLKQCKIANKYKVSNNHINFKRLFLMLILFSLKSILSCKDNN